MLFKKGAYQLLPIVAVGIASLALSACKTTEDPSSAMAQAAPPPPAAIVAGTEPPTTPTVEEPGTVKYYPSDEPARLGIENFNRGNYGLAEKYFRDAVERAPRDVTSWIGLAASYDRLARFDLADRAYRYAIRLAGETTQILNNQGYSYMLRGNYVKARQKLLQAAAREPGNPVIQNNLQLLDGSHKYVQRDGF